MNPTVDDLELITGTDGDPQKMNAVRMHAALIGNAIKKTLRNRMPMTMNATGSLRGPIAGQTGGESQFWLRGVKGCRTLICKNYSNITAYIWQGDDVSGMAWITVAANSWLQFSCDPAIEVYTISVKQPQPGQGNPAYATSGSIYVQSTDSDLGCASGALAV